MTATAADVRVLIVDDTPDMRLLLRVMLGHYPGFDVVAEAGDGLEAIEQAHRWSPDLVLLDLAMPQMDGLEALPRIRAAAPDAQVVVFSGFDAARLGEPALSAGAAAYVQKGAAPEELIATISGVLGRDIPVRTQARVASSAPRPPVIPQDDAFPTEVGTAEEHAAKAVARAAHELRNPAIALTLLAEELAATRDTLDASGTERLVDAIVRQAGVIDQLTTDLLTSAHARRGSLSVRGRPIPLRPVLETAAAAVADRLSVALECPAELVVHADPLRMQQLLTNLLINAVKYGAPPVRVAAAATTPAGTHAEIRVEDCGPGVPEWFRDQLFDEYSQAEPDRGTGSGIGLFVVRSIARAQGGDAWYEPGATGAAFCVSVPLAAA